MAETNISIPTVGQLESWEKMRQSGDLKKVVEDTRYVLNLPIEEEFPKLNADKKVRFVKWARLYVDPAKSMAAQAPDADGVYENLKKAKAGIDGIYNHPLVQDFLKTPDGTDLLPHTVRDKAKYLTTLSALTGDSVFLNIAVKMLEEVAKVTNDVSDKALIAYEAKRPGLRSGNITFRETQNAYEESYGLAKSLNQWERASSVSAFYAVDSLVGRKPFEFAKAVYNFGTIMLKDRTNWKALPSQIYKHFTEKGRHKNWKETKDSNINYANELEIK